VADGDFELGQDGMSITSFPKLFLARRKKGVLSVQKWQWVERARTSVRPFFSQLAPGSGLLRSVPAVTGCWNSVVFGLAGAGCDAGAVTTWFLNSAIENKTATTRVAKFAAISTLRNSSFHRPVSPTDRTATRRAEQSGIPFWLPRQDSVCADRLLLSTVFSTQNGYHAAHLHIPAKTTLP